MANELKQVYDAATTVISLAATLNNAANTYSGLAGLTMTDLSNSLNYPKAVATLNITDTFAAAPTAGGTIDLYMTMNDIDGTSDETPVPGASDILYLAKYIGSWIIDNQDVATIKPIIIDLTGVTSAKFYIYNNCGQQISYSSTATVVKIKPLSYAPT